MSVEIAYTGTALIVEGERVQRNWGFARKGMRKYCVIYRVARWGRTTVTVEVDAEHHASTSYRRDFGRYETRRGTRGTEIIMSREAFVDFVQRFYGGPMASALEERRIRQDAQRRQYAQEQEQYARNAAQTEISDILESIQTALDSPKGLYAIADLIDAAHAAGRAEAEEEMGDSYSYDY